MITNAQAMQALAFAKLHDWGREARLEGETIVNLIDSYTVRSPVDGTVTAHEERVSRRATVGTLRDFGGY